MTTNFELASTNPYKTSNNLLSPSIPTRNPVTISTETSHADPSATRQDTANLASTSLFSAPAQDASRAAQIAALSRSIAGGTYSIPAYEVAGSIIDFLF